MDETHLLGKDSKWCSLKTQRAYKVLDFATNAATGMRCVIYTDGKEKFLLPVDKFLEGFRYCQPSPVVVVD